MVRKIVGYWDGVLAVDRGCRAPSNPTGQAYFERSKTALERAKLGAGLDPPFQLWVTLWEENG